MNTIDLKTKAGLTEPRWIRISLIAIAWVFLAALLLIPLFAIFFEALRQGWQLYIASLTHPDALSAIKLTLITAAVVVPINAVLGICIAWLLTRFDFRGKQLLTTLLDLPFSVSPVVAGLMFVLLFGSNSLFGGWLESMGFQVIFAVPGIILATLFVTFPFVARELIPLMQRHGVVYQSHQFGRDLCHAGRRLHQTGIARTQSRHSKTHDLPHRVIPRHHRQHHAQRLKAHLRQTRLGGDGFAVEQFGRKLGVITD